MSKQYLTLHNAENVHPTDIYALAPTSTQLLSASGASAIRIFSTTAPDFPLVQTLDGAHKLGCHHLATSRNGKKAASAGFEGKAGIWSFEGESETDGQWVSAGTISDNNEPGEIWAIALSEDGRYLASTAYNGCINVWDLGAADMPRIRRYETKGSFGLTIDLSRDGRFTASGHENGGLYIFNNDTGRMLHSLAGLIKPVRAVSFSPLSTLLAAAGDSRIISLYDVNSGEQVANLTGHTAWIFSLDWNDTGEYLLSGSFDGKVKVWSTELRTCVATHTETDETIWSTKWLPKRPGLNEMFAVAGASKGIRVYREAAGQVNRPNGP